MADSTLHRAQDSADEASVLEQSAAAHSSEGNGVAALRTLERALTSRLKALRYLMNGSGSGAEIAAYRAALVKSSEKVVVQLNALGVQSFRAQQFDESEEYLQSALRMVEGEATRDYFPVLPSDHSGSSELPAAQRLLSTTLNNLGCFERRKGNLEAALAYMKRATKVCGSMSPIALLNMSAACSALGRSDEALHYSRKAVDLLQSGLALPTPFQGLLAVAHHSIALATEVSDPSESQNHYKKALEIARKELGNGSATTGLIQRNMSNFVAQRRMHPMSSGVYGEPIGPGTATPSEGAEEREQTDDGKGKDIAESVLQSVDSSTAVLMDTQRDRRRATIESVSSSARAFVPIPPTASATGRAPRQTKAEAAMAKRASMVEKKASTLGPPLPCGVAPGEPHKDEEERRKEDLLSYLYGRLKDLLKHEEWTEQRYQAAVRIQCVTRVFLAKKIVKQLKKKRRQRAKRQWEKEKLSAGVIVRFLRGLVQRRRQAILDKKREHEERLQRKVASVLIQSGARRWLARQYARRLRNYYKRYHEGVRTLQCWFRVVLSRLYNQRMRTAQSLAYERRSLEDKQRYASTLIQKVYRAHRSRINVLVLRGDVKAAREMDWQSNRSHAVRTIQRLYRGYRVRKYTSPVLKRMKKKRLITQRTTTRRQAATQIQRLFRGHNCRSTHPEVQIHRVHIRRWAAAALQQRAALHIQCAVRCWFAKRRMNILKARRSEKEVKLRTTPCKPFVPPQDWQHWRKERMMV